MKTEKDDFNVTAKRGRCKAPRHRVAGKDTKLLAVVILFTAITVACARGAHGGVEKVDAGIKFTYFDPDAGTVFLAGTFNGWSTTANPMIRDESGNWTVVMQLSEGKHEYKFVVDGAWITDFDNPNSTADPYGGTNSVVEINGSGNIVERAAAQPTSNTALSSRVYIGGRYLSRTRVARGVEDDPRWRAQRPVQNVDFNFRITISDMVHGYTRMRIDTEENFLQPNNIQLFLDEAHLEINPAAFTLRGYYNEEVLASGDPLRLVGDTDLPGTIFDDHVKAGKGTAGAVLTTNILGADIEGLMANVHDFDINNDQRLFDNTGTDVAHARASRKFRNMTPGANFFFERNLWWLDFTPLVGTTPANTGLPRLDEYLDRTGDPSDWFEFEDKLYLYGPDITFHLLEDELLPQFEILWGEIKQGFVTSNRSGINLDNGPIDVPIFDRDLRIMHGSVRSTLIDRLPITIEHSRYELMHDNDGEGYLTPVFVPDEGADKHIFFLGTSDPPNVTIDYSEATIGWNEENIGGRLWLERYKSTYESPESDPDAWLYMLCISPGLRWNPVKRFTIELEHKYRNIDLPASFEMDQTTFETITRGSFDVTNTLSAIFDIRNIYIDDELYGDSKSYTAPFVGIRYRPAKKVDLVLAYGVDPLDFDIDYNGRRTGRYNHRQEYFWQYGGPTPTYYGLERPRYALPMPGYAYREAEEALADAKMIVLRVIYNF
jgi:hypothetical protein